MKRLKIIDSIKSQGTLIIQNIVEYLDTYSIDDLGDNGLITKKMLVDFVNPYIPLPPTKLDFPAGSPNPIVLDMANDYPEYGGFPLVLVYNDFGADNYQRRFDVIPIENRPTFTTLNTLSFDNGGGATTLDDLIILIG